MKLEETKQLQHIHILIISHRYGQNIEAHRSENSALSGLYDYVSEWWDESLDTRYGRFETLDRTQAIASYFDAQADHLNGETFVLEKRPLIGTDTNPSPLSQLAGFC